MLGRGALKSRARVIATRLDIIFGIVLERINFKRGSLTWSEGLIGLGWFLMRSNWLLVRRIYLLLLQGFVSQSRGKALRFLIVPTVLLFLSAKLPP